MKRPRSAAAQHDALSGEVALRAHVDGTGLTIAGKSRALTAFDRLLGGVIGIPAELLEGVRKRMELRGTAREKFLVEQLSAEPNAIINDDSLVSAAARRTLLESARTQMNRESIFVSASEALANFDHEETSSPLSSADESETLEEDWINVFANYAEKASSQRLQQMWGRILAGEIRNPASFALSTLRVISELDASTAAGFQEVVTCRLRSGLLVKPQSLEGDELLKWVLLEEAGLLQDVNAGLSWTVNTPGTIAETENYCLVATASGAMPYLQVPLVKVSRAGDQIANILPWNESAALHGFARYVPENVGLAIHRVLARTPSGLQARICEVIRQPGL